MSVEVKPGWWRNENVHHPIVRIVDRKISDGRWIVEFSSGGLLSMTFKDDGAGEERCMQNHKLVEYLPDCTGFDWVPEPKCVPFTRETVPRDAWYSGSQSGEYRIIEVDDFGVTLGGVGNSWVSWEFLMDHYTIDGKPAGRLA